MNKTQIIFIGIILFLLGIGGYELVAGKTRFASQVPQHITESPTNTSASPTPPFNLTANWKTYTDEQFGFSFMYPEDYYKYLYVDDESPPHNFSMHITPWNNPEAKNGILPLDSVQLGVAVRDDVQMLNDLLGSEPYTYSGTEKEATSIGGEKGYKVNNINVSATQRRQGFTYTGIAQHKNYIYFPSRSDNLFKQNKI